MRADREIEINYDSLLQRCLVRSQIISKLYDSCKSKPWTVILPDVGYCFYIPFYILVTLLSYVMFISIFFLFFLEDFWYNLCWGKSLLPQKIHLLFRLLALVILTFISRGKHYSISCFHSKSLLHWQYSWNVW